MKITIKSRLVGSGTFGPPISPVDLELPDGAGIRMGDLIEKAVHEQVRVMDAQEDLDAEQVRGTFERQYGRLPGEAPEKQEGTADELDSSGGERGARLIDPEAELRNAKRAYETGRLAVVADGKHVEGMETVVELKEGSKVTFMRLIQVAGG